MIRDQYLTNWNTSSSLCEATRIILYKLEGSSDSSPIPNAKAKPAATLPNNNEVNNVTREFMQTLKGKSIDDLLFVYYNLDHYSFDFLKKERSENERLLNEVNDLYLQLQSRKADFSGYQKEIEETEKSIESLHKQKSQYDKLYQKDEIMGKLDKYIEEKLYKPKSQLISDFHNKKIEYDEYKNKFKELALNYYYYTIIREKLNSIK